MAPSSPPQRNQADRISLLEKRLQLADDIDALLERCFIEHKDLAAAIDVVFTCLQGHLHPALMFLRTFGDDLEMRTYTVGIVPELLEQRLPEVLRTTRPIRKDLPGVCWYGIPLDMSGETVGAMGLAFPACGRPQHDEDIFCLMNAVAEELDNYFYAIQETRRKHQFLLDIQKALGNRVLHEGISSAISILLRHAGCKDLLLLYFDEDLSGDAQLHYFFFRDGQQLFNADKTPLRELDTLMGTHSDPFHAPDSFFETIIPLPDGYESHLLAGDRAGHHVARLLVTPTEGTGLSVQTRELIQTFSESLRQRLADFNRERNQLRRHFSVDVTNRLLNLKDYAARHLSPRTSTIGVLVADLTAFSLLSSQVLKEPRAIADFIDRWSAGVVKAIFQEQGTLDKLIGDGIIALFGPPFDDLPAAEIVGRMIRAALFIRSFTRAFLRRQEFAAVQEAPFFRDLGVGISLHYGRAHVGQIGPHHDFTGFGDGLSQALRLQVHTRADQILVTAPVGELGSKIDSGRYNFAPLERLPGLSGQPDISFHRMKL